MYELAALLALASAYFALRLVDGDRPVSSTSQIIGYWIATALAFYNALLCFLIWVAVIHICSVDTRKTPRGSRPLVPDSGDTGRGFYPLVHYADRVPANQGKRSLRRMSWRGVELIFGKTALALDWAFTRAAARDPGIMPAPPAADWRSMRPGASTRRTLRPWLAPLLCIVPVAIAWIVNPIMPFFFERYVLVALPGFT